MNLFKNKIVKGTLVLTVAGFLTRILGFFYRIFLSDQLGASLLGSYQLVFPLYGICFTIYGAGIQTAISQLIAAAYGKQAMHQDHASSEEIQVVHSHARRILWFGMTLSLCLSMSLCIFTQIFSVPIATRFLLEPSCAPYLRILSVLFPFCGITACINGYYYGIQDAKIPAITQIIEQIFRLSFVFLVITLLHTDPETGCQIAVWGLVVGEVFSNFYILYKMFGHRYSERKIHTILQRTKKEGLSPLKKSPIFRPLCSLSFTLTGTKLIVSLLHSAEAVFIPAALRKYGCTPSEALGIYGILSGIVMPFLLFPSSIFNSIAVMLLPAVADSQASGQENQIRHYVSVSVRYCLLIGFLFTLLFFFFGNPIGQYFFHSQTAGSFLRILSWFCPFFYLSTTLGSIINGLGKPNQTFLITVISQAIKIYSLVVWVPLYGIHAYLNGMLISQIVMAVLSCVVLRRYLLPLHQNTASVNYRSH